jgi:hypothetical protein
MSIPGQTDSFEVTVLHGFSTGRVGGLQIDYFSLFLPIVPSRFPDTTLPTDPAVFEPALSMPGVTAGVGIKHHTDPSFWPFGVSAPGPLLTASVAAVRRGA